MLFPQKVMVVSCNVTEKPDAGATELDVSVRIGEGEPFRLRTHNGRVLKLRNFSHARDPLKSVEWITALFQVGCEIEATLDRIHARFQIPVDGFLKSDRAIDPMQIRSKSNAVARTLAPLSSVRASSQEPIMMNGGDRMVTAR